MRSMIDGSVSGRRGTVLVMVIVTLTVLVGMTLAFLTVTMSANREVIGAGGELRARYLAEAAITEGLAAKRHGGRVRVDGLASLVAPVAFGGVEYEDGRRLGRGSLRRWATTWCR